MRASRIDSLSQEEQDLDVYYGRAGMRLVLGIIIALLVAEPVVAIAQQECLAVKKSETSQCNAA